MIVRWSPEAAEDLLQIVEFIREDNASAAAIIGIVTNKVQREMSFSVFYEETPEGGYVAFVPALPGCHTQGDTLEEA
jgi:hypothetical protein